MALLHSRTQDAYGSHESLDQLWCVRNEELKVLVNCEHGHDGVLSYETVAMLLSAITDQRPKRKNGGRATG